MSMRIIVIAATEQSELSLGLLEMSLREGQQVVGVIIRKTLTLERLKEEMRFGLVAFLKKNVTKILQRYSGSVEEQSGWGKFLEHNFIARRSITSACNEYNIPVFKTVSLNSTEASLFVKTLMPTLAIFGGGGLVRAELLNCVPIVNCHMGLLPKYRGNYPWIWALINKEYDQIGLSIHLMEERLDLGPILKNVPIKITKNQSLFQLGKDLEYAMIPEIISALTIAEKYLDDKIPEGCYQKELDGKQYYVPHNMLIKLAEKNLKIYHKG